MRWKLFFFEYRTGSKKCNQKSFAQTTGFLAKKKDGFLIPHSQYLKKKSLISKKGQWIGTFENLKNPLNRS